MKKIFVGLLVVSMAALYGCGGGGGTEGGLTGGTGSIPSSVAGQTNGLDSLYTNQTGEVGITAPMDVGTVANNGSPFGWATIPSGSTANSYGTVQFNADAATHLATTGTLTTTVPTASSVTFTWSTNGGWIDTTTNHYLPIAWNTSAGYYVVSYTNASKLHLGYQRWYYGANAATAAQTYSNTAGTGTTTTLAFTSSMLAGKTATVTRTGGTSTFAFAASGNTVTSGSTSGTFTINSNGSLTLTFPTNTLTYTITAQNGNILTVTNTHAATPTQVEGPNTMTII